MSDWISVEERLPEKGGPYLVANGEDVRCGYFRTSDFVRIEITSAAKAEFGSGGIRYDCVPDTVTHWMPLPPPPEVKRCD